VLIIVGVIAVGGTLTGCSPSHELVAPGFTVSTPGASVSASPAPTAPPTTAAAAGSYGDVVALASVTDSLGTYEQTTISPSAAVMQQGTVKVNTASLTAAGFTVDDAFSAQKWIAKFSAEQISDSTALDISDGWSQWKVTEAPKFIGAQVLTNILQSAAGSDRSGVILNDPNNNLPHFIRDGKPRLSSNKVAVNTLEGYSDSNGKYIHVVGSNIVKYRATGAQALASVQRQQPTASSSDLRSKYPKFFTNSEISLTYKISWSYYLAANASSTWSIAGYSSNTAVTDDGSGK